MTMEGSVPRPARGLAALGVLLRDIKLAHTVFAMPFAVLAVVLARDAAGSRLDLGVQLALVAACMVAARTWAMLINRVADRRIDAANPRTASRALASGRVRTGVAAVAAAVSGASLVALAAAFGILFGNWWPVALSVPVLGWIAFYSFTKRFTWLCHVFLGGALAASPLAAALAVRPGALADTPSLWWLAGMVVTWVSGFDVIYALQDEAFDRGAGLHSAPARFGARGSAWISRSLHGLALACLVLAWRADPRLGAPFAVGIVLAAALLVAEHVVLARRGLRGLDLAFFTLNGVVSVVLGVLGLADVLWEGAAGAS